MNENLRKDIDQLMAIQYWKFDGLPDQITTGLTTLLATYSADAIVNEMKSAIPDYEDDEKNARKCAGNSGIAGEMHMAAGMRHKYLMESLEYLAKYL